MRASPQPLTNLRLEVPRTASRVFRPLKGVLARLALYEMSIDETQPVQRCSRRREQNTVEPKSNFGMDPNNKMWTCPGLQASGMVPWSMAIMGGKDSCEL